MSGSVRHLAKLIAARASGLRGSSGEEQAALDHLVSAAGGTGPTRTVVRSVRHEALAARAARIEYSARGATDDILEALRGLEDPLPWVYHYEPRTASEDLSERVAFAELIGPDGALAPPVGTPPCRIGFTVLDATTVYPLHAHPAVELYWVLAGRARWQTLATDRRVPPGDLVLHRSNEPHAMQTFEEPLVALWAWSGEIDAPARYL